MISKVVSALARALDPIKPIDRPGQNLSTAKSADGGEGGYSPNGYDTPSEENPGSPDGSAADAPDEGKDPAARKLDAVPFRPGLTQVILDLNGRHPEPTRGAAAATYRTGAKDQKIDPPSAKGSKLDKKAA